MAQYVFILGNNPRLSVAEITAVLPKNKIVAGNERYLVLESEIFDCQKILRQLGGTVKIGKVIANLINPETIANELLKEEVKGKIIFGFSDYSLKKSGRDYFKMGLEIKSKLKKLEKSVRLVTAREPILSSVIVAKNKCQEFLILDNDTLAKTCAVQEFEEYGTRDYGRPARDAKSGLLPPKLAKIMINLSGAKSDDKILDPFCGSGTILQEAILLGYKNITGCDASPRAIEDTKKNLEWLAASYQLPALDYQLMQFDVRKLSGKVSGMDAIITEPYLGPALWGNESPDQIKNIIKELSKLYLDSFREFKKILKAQGRIVMVFPAFRQGLGWQKLSIISETEKIGFKRLNSGELTYGRPDQKIMREINIFEKK